MLELVHELYGVGLNISYLFIRLGTHLALAAEANRVSAIFTNRVYMYTDNCLMQTACRQAAPPSTKVCLGRAVLSLATWSCYVLTFVSLWMQPFASLHYSLLVNRT